MPTITRGVAPTFSNPTRIRQAIYTTNTIASLNMTLRKVTKSRSLFPTNEAVFKLMYLALRNVTKRETMLIKNWSGAMNQFAILFEGQVPMGAQLKPTYTESGLGSLLEIVPKLLHYRLI